MPHRPDEYWAGIFDGDGSIRLTINQGKRRPRVSVRMTHEATIQMLHEDMGCGAFYYCHPPSSARNPKWKPRWAFEANTRAAEKVIQRLYPFLIEKTSAAREALAFYSDLIPPTGERSIAYWAGIVDAEGHIGTSMTSNHPRPVISVKMACEPVIRQMHAFFNIGSLRSVTYHLRINPDYKPAWMYIAKTRQAVSVIKQLRPFLITKAADADNVLAYYQCSKHQKRIAKDCADCNGSIHFNPFI